MIDSYQLSPRSLEQRSVAKLVPYTSFFVPSSFLSRIIIFISFQNITNILMLSFLCRVGKITHLLSSLVQTHHTMAL